MAKKLGIIAYGTAEDRARLEALAKIAGLSASQWIVQQIRTQYKEQIDAG